MSEMREPPADQSWLEMETGGKVLHVGTMPHVCRPPEILSFGPPGESDIPTVTTVYPQGSVWQCACGIVWVADWEPPYAGRGFISAGEIVWRRERRRERRKRLGSRRWWQRLWRQTR